MSVLSIGLFTVPWYFKYLVFGAVYCSLSLKSYLWGFIDGYEIHPAESLSLAFAQCLQKLWGPLDHPHNAASRYTIHEQATNNHKFLQISLFLPVAKTTFPEVPSAEGEEVYFWLILTLRGAQDLNFSLWQQPKFFQISIAVWKRVFFNFPGASVQFSSVHSLSCVQLFAAPWTAAHQASCPSPTPGAYSNSCPLSRWCHPTISSSVLPFSSHLQSFPASGSFQMSQLFASGGHSIGVSASASVLPVNIQDWSPLGWTGWISLQSKGLSRVFSNITVQKHQFFSVQLSSQSNSHIHTWLLEKQ